MQRRHVVIVGAGFGRLAAAQGLRNVDTDVTLVDKRNTRLFQFLLYQLAPAGLSPADFRRMQVSGHFARMLDCVAHIRFRSGFRNRFLVGANWLWNYLTVVRGARLIADDSSPDWPATLASRLALRAPN